MNETLPQSVIDDALVEDLAAAQSEYLGLFREDIVVFIGREIIESVVVKNRLELLPNPHIQYLAFCDISGGRNDDATICIGHKKERKVIVDFAKRYQPPHSPYAVIASMSEELRRYGVKKMVGDNYSANFVQQAFESQGIKYQKSELPKSGLYLELLPRLCSGEIELLDNETLINQLSSLERRTRSGGRDSVDHPQGGRDDLANSVAGLASVVSKRVLEVGGLGGGRGYGLRRLLIAD